MRPLALILLLLLSVACYSSGAEDDRGVVIDGLCPAEVEPVTVRSRRHPEDTDVWEVRATAHQGRIVLEWDEPIVPGVTGYVVARHSYDMQGYLEHGSVRTFAGDEDPNDRHYSDTADIEPRTRYQYRIFPVTGAGIGFPSWPLVIWSLPAERPNAPLTATIKDYGDRRALRATHSFLKPATDALVLRRGSADEQWQVVHEPRIRDDDWWSPTEGDFVFVDEDGEPGVRYEYAVCYANRVGVGRATLLNTSRSLDSETAPDIVERRPLAVLDFEAEPTSDGVRLTWILPADTTLEGLLVRETRVDNGHPGSFPPMVLPSYQTEYLALTRGYSPGASHYSFDVETFNDFGTQAVGSQREYVYSTEFMHCTATTEELLWANREQITIRFRACEETLTQVVRRELTADGFEVSTFRQPCVWAQTEVNPNQYGSDELEGTLTCEYDDTGVKPGTWYVYELTQTLKDGRTFTSHHDVVTRPLYVAP